jgi:peptidylprolyl isomerase
MKPTTALLLLIAAPLAAQTPASHPAHRSATAASHPSASGACAKLPDISPKIPALPAGTPCAKPLYTLTVEPSIKINYVSPLEGTALEDTLGLHSETFSVLYIDAKLGTGELVQPHKWFTIQYTGYLTDGTVFDSSLNKPEHEPFVFQYGGHQVIAGWDTAFAGMRVGGKRRIFIPYQLAYGPNGNPPRIPGKAELIFDVELVAQSDTKPAPPAPPAPPKATTPTAPTAPPSDQPATPPVSAEPKPQ